MKNPNADVHAKIHRTEYTPVLSKIEYVHGKEQGISRFPLEITTRQIIRCYISVDALEELCYVIIP